MQTILMIYYIFISFIICSSNCLRVKNKPRYCANKPKINNDNPNKPDFVHLVETKEKEIEAGECKFYDPGEVDNHLLPQECSHDFKFSHGTVINPYEGSREYQNEDMSLKSACLKCAACLAIADNINKTFTDLYYEKQTSSTPNDGNYDCKGLQNLCLNGFKNYDLREYNGSRLITKSSIYSKHINSKMDGNWTRTLRDLCCTYVQHMNVNEIFHRYKSGTINFTDFLCKGDGIFRDCKNLELKFVEVPPKEENFNVCVNCF